jgi:endonuclease/exonuclease/phosphatase family metal-dependent hydrolase
MSRCVNIGVRTAGAALVAGALFFAPSTVAAQTTVTIDDPVREVDDARIQGGKFANTVFHKERLATKAYPDLAYTRRTMLKFDTHNTVPAGATVQSATLILTLSQADPGTRNLTLYRLANTFDEQYTNWYRRRNGNNWTRGGGDFAEKWATTSVGSTVRSKVSFDVTALVQAVVKGKYGSSRYTRMGLVDLGSSSNKSYKEFFNSEYSDTSVRPVLKVVYGGSASTPKPTPTPTPTTSTPKPTPTPTPKPTPTPDDPPSSSTGSRLKLLNWNTHYGMGTDGKYNIDRIATFIAKFNPDVVSLNEVTRYAYYNSREDQATRYAALLKAKTGRTWYHYYRTDNGASTGVGNIVLSRFPIASTSYCQLSGRRVAVKAAIYVNGRLLNIWSTHLDSASGSTMRLREIRALHACVGNFAEQKIIAGDFNAWPSKSEISVMASGGFRDAWANAAAQSTAVSYPGNTSFGATRNSRIDYVWTSAKATSLVVKRAEVFDTRDSSRRMPSDHKPLLVTFEVR